MTVDKYEFFSHTLIILSAVKYRVKTVDFFFFEKITNAVNFYD